MQHMSRHPYSRIADELREELEGGVYPEGEPMPSTVELQRRFGVAAMTIRSAMSVLRNEGYVRTVQGRGVYPVPPKARRLQIGPSAEAEIEDVRTEPDPVEQARKATELLQLYDIRLDALTVLRRRAIARAELDGLKRTQIAKRLGLTKSRISQIMDGQPTLSSRAPSSRRRA